MHRSSSSTLALLVIALAAAAAAPLATDLPIVFPVSLLAIAAVLVAREVTERRPANPGGPLVTEAGEHDDRRFRRYIECAPGAVLVSDRRGRLLEGNPAALRLLGHSAEALPRLTVFDLFDPEVHDRIAADLERLGESGQLEGEYRARRADGRDVLLSVKAVRLGPNRLVAYFDDVTARAAAQHELRASEARHRAFFEQSAAGMAEVDADSGALLRVNARLCELTGRPAEALLGRTFAELGAGEPFGPAPQELLRGRSVGGQMRFLRPDGEEAWVEIALSPLTGERACGCGNLRAAVVVDLTASKRAEGARAEGERRFRMMIEQSTDMTLVLDQEGRIAFCSPAVTAALGFEPEALRGRPLTELADPTDVVAGWPLGTGPSSRARIRLRHADGTWRLIDATARDHLAEPAVGGFVVNGRDITEQQDLEEQYRQAQKLESIGRLAGGVAHDFNNLLTVILSCCELARDDARRAQPSDPEDLEAIYSAACRGRDLTRQLLAFARRQVIEPRNLDLSAVVGGSEKLLRRVLGEDVELRVAGGAGLWPVHCDPGQIEQILMNLAVNAGDAMPEGGVLTIETANLKADAGDYVRLIVRDTGHGMPPEVMAHIFEPFFTTKPEGQGTGLGLATVWGIVMQSGGRIDVDSTPGFGTTFTVDLPRARAALLPAVPSAVPMSARGAETLLVVEDDASVRHVIARTLRAAGFEVLAAPDGPSALRLMELRDAPVPLVVSDVVMPGMDGRRLVDELLRRELVGQALFLSGHSYESMGQRGALDEGAALLLKPFTPGALVSRVRSLLDADQPSTLTASPTPTAPPATTRA